MYRRCLFLPLSSQFGPPCIWELAEGAFSCLCLNFVASLASGCSVLVCLQRHSMRRQGTAGCRTGHSLVSLRDTDAGSSSQQNKACRHRRWILTERRRGYTNELLELYPNSDLKGRGILDLNFIMPRGAADMSCPLSKIRRKTGQVSKTDVNYALKVCFDPV